MQKKAIETYDSIGDNDPLKVDRKTRWMNFKEVNMLKHPEFSELSQELAKYMQQINHRYFEEVCHVVDQRLKCKERFTDYEAPRIKRYEPGEGVFHWHIDHIDVTTSRRALVMFWYLNDVEEGGATAFDLGDGEEMRIHPQAGNVACFPPYFMFVHKGEIPISHPKYVISSYVHLPQDYGIKCD